MIMNFVPKFFSIIVEPLTVAQLSMISQTNISSVRNHNVVSLLTLFAATRGLLVSLVTFFVN